MTVTALERRIRWSGLLIVAGLLLQLFTLPLTHPLAFVGFVVLGCPLVAAGMLFFLYTLVTHDTAH